MDAPLLQPRRRISADIGGTFTDVVVYDEETGAYASGKSTTDPADLSAGVVAAIETVLPSLAPISFAVHGTTVGLNAFLERRGARVLLLVTAGTRDVYHIARGSRHRIYDLRYRKPTPLIPRSDIVEIRGRLNAVGEEITPLEEADVRVAIDRARREDFGAVAVAFLFSHLNPIHELRVAELFEALNLPTSLSHRVAREPREYERTSTTVLDAYTGRVVGDYLSKLEGDLKSRDLRVPLHVMQSSGGVMTADAGRTRPLHTLLSGPVGGTMGGVGLVDELHQPHLLCVDMGGTSFDLSLVVDGRPSSSSEATLDGFPVLMPIVDIHTIGAGGGSVAYVEAGGLRVGPESAGAFPGPVCYGRGGLRPTVTDANLALRRIDPGYFLGGRMDLDVAAADAALAKLGRELRLTGLELAEGVVEVINAKMGQAIRTVTVERGIEPRDFVLLAYGGAGPTHAIFLAQELEISQVIIPRGPGTFSAWGMLQTALRHDFTAPYLRSTETVDLDDLLRAFAAMFQDGRHALRADNVQDSSMDFESMVEMRYEGQEYTLPVSWPADLDGARALELLVRRFHDGYAARFGHADQSAAPEIVALRVAAHGDLGRSQSRDHTESRRAPAQDRTTRQVRFNKEWHETVIVLRSQFGADDCLIGPVIIEEETTTSVVPPGWRVSVDPLGSLICEHAEPVLTS